MADELAEPCVSFDGRRIRFRPGQSVGGALFAEGRHLISRSFKYHRPRGLFCVSGRCPNCLCTVDGAPNVRICATEARPGMVVKSQNAWPSPDLDALALLDKFDEFMPVGFYYKQMYRPRWMWPKWEKLIRRVAGLGSIDLEHGADGRYEHQNLFTDVAVIGGGWAGLHAALAARDAGAEVALIDEQPQLGGHMRHDPDLRRPELAGLIADVDREVQHSTLVLLSATAFGCYEENLLGIQQGNRMIRLRAGQVIVATGGWERPFVFENNDLPGNLLASGAQRLMHLDGCKLDGAAVVFTDNSQGYRAARQLAASGTRIAAIVDLRSEPAESPGGISVRRGYTIVSAEGRRHVKAAIVTRREGDDRTERIECRWIVQAIGFTPANGLLYQNGCKLRHDESLDHAVVDTFAAGMHAAGSVLGTHDPDKAALEGRLAGLAAAAALGPSDPDIEARLSDLRRALGDLAQPATAQAGVYVAPPTGKKRFVCLCEDVTEKDLVDAIGEGYSNIETLKRYSTVSMGPCQGKMCQAASVAICARVRGQSIEQTGTTTARPPEQPVPLGMLAGRLPHLQLVRRTPLHAWHVGAGAKLMDAGNWKRVESYTTPEEEYAAVRERAGLIDVSTLGKLDLRGRDVAAFLEYLYPNKFADLKLGRTRYGVICDAGGIIVDDGTVSRLADDRFVVSTTTGNADGVESWFRFTIAARPSLEVRLTNVTGSFAAMNLAGPRSREILAKLTEAGVSATDLPYLAVGQFPIASVDATVFRIGFVGELGYEIHVPSQYGLHVWEAILTAGQEHGIRPFGVEAQRRLRLDKKHLIVTVDTDALSSLTEADMPWIIKWDKPDFVGKRILERRRKAGPRERLVGFRLGGQVVPDEASLIVKEGRLSGRVTSCRFSPAAGAPVGLAWLPLDMAQDGKSFEIQFNGERVQAIVQDEPFYDPKGEKLKG